MNRRFTQRLALTLAVLALVVLLPWPAAGVEVTATGRAPGDVANARERALTDALREAVRVGAGLDLITATKVQDFSLEYDRVFAHAFGYVREYRVIKQEVDQAGLYCVTVKATVEKGPPPGEDKLALMQLVRLKGSPRVGVRTSGQIANAPGADAAMVLGLFRELALEMKMQVVDTEAQSEAEARRARRDELVGETKDTTTRRAEVMSPCDFLIRVSLQNSSYNGVQRVYQMPTHTFSLGADLSAGWPDTGEAIVQVTVDSTDVSSTKGGVDAAARDAVSRFLMGEIPATRKKNALTLFQRILCQWVTDLDLGAKLQIELKAIPREALDALVRGLRETEGISGVWVRHYDNQLFSKLEVESRPNADQLKDEVLRHIGAAFELTSYQTHYLQFAPKAAVPAPAGPPAGPGTAGTPSARTGLPPWVWALGGAGAMGLLFGVYALGRRGSTR